MGDRPKYPHPTSNKHKKPETVSKPVPEETPITFKDSFTFKDKISLADIVVQPTDKDRIIASTVDMSSSFRINIPHTVANVIEQIGRDIQTIEAGTIDASAELKLQSLKQQLYHFNAVLSLEVDLSRIS